MQFVDLKAQYQTYRDEIDAEIRKVIESAAFINGPAIKDLEVSLAEHTGVKHAIGCSSGTDALSLAMMALGVQAGDEVIVPDFSFFATAETVALLGAVPVFADIRPDTYTVDPAAVEAVVSERTRGIIPVSLYGQVADMDEINAIAEENDLWVIEDAAQSYGATYKGRRSAALSTIGTTSFFPAKPLGCYGDGGAVFTNDDQLASRLRMILNHGQSSRYDHAVIGLNARLDTIQAAVLKVKLAHFEDEIEQRQKVADKYTELLSDVVRTPHILSHNRSVWAQYTIRVPDRPAVQSSLKDAGIPTAVHYPIPLHRQDALSHYASPDHKFPESERAAREVLSLPMHPFLSKDDVENVAVTIRNLTTS